MTRSCCLLVFVLSLAAVRPASAGEPTPAERRRHREESKELNDSGMKLHGQGKSAEAIAKLEKALALRQRLYPVATFPNGHADLSESLNNLAFVLRATGATRRALELYQQALVMNRKLYPNGDGRLAVSLINMGVMMRQAGDYEKAAEYYREALAMNRKAFPNGHSNLAANLSNLGQVLRILGATAKARDLFEEALEMNRRVYPLAEFPNGNPHLLYSLVSLAGAEREMGLHEQARAHLEQALEMGRQQFPMATFPAGHVVLATILNDIGSVMSAMGSPERAIGYYEQSLAMYRNLFPPSVYPDGHFNLSASLTNLGVAENSLGSPQRGLEYFEQSLAMDRKLYPVAKFPDGHPQVAIDLMNNGRMFQIIKSYEKSTQALDEALDIFVRNYPPDRYPNGHPFIAQTLGHLGLTADLMGAPEKARVFRERSLAMDRKLYPVAVYPDGHPSLAKSLTVMGEDRAAVGEDDKALSFLAEALAMQQRMIGREILSATENQALAQIAALRYGASDDFYSAASRQSKASAAYEILWAEKGRVQQILARRHLEATVRRRQSTEIDQQFSRLNEVRGEIARLVNRPGKDLAARDRQLATLSDEQERLERDLVRQIPMMSRDKELARQRPSDLLVQLPERTVLIDFVRYQHSEKGRLVGPRYLAFVLAKGKPTQLVELGDANAIDRAVTEWRAAIEANQSAKMGERLRELVWAKMATRIPSGTETLYLAPDGDLARVPWAALPMGGGRVLLEDFALATVPNGPFLLERLKSRWVERADSIALALGKVTYDSPSWPELPGTEIELKSLAIRKPVTLTGADAASARLLAELPKADVAHLATHGFFDSAALTAEKQREAKSLKNRQFGDELRPVASKNPLGYVGLVLAKSEILTGLSLVDLPLENLNLVTLSACETGLGELTGGEGVQGLQRAFHLAGCPNVVASLWKVNDAATAALMVKFYHEMWVNKKPPIEALREAQLTIYRHPELIPDLAGERGAPRLKEAVAAKVAEPGASASGVRRADTRQWAAFVLSGLGR